MEWFSWFPIVERFIGILICWVFVSSFKTDVDPNRTAIDELLLMLFQFSNVYCVNCPPFNLDLGSWVPIVMMWSKCKGTNTTQHTTASNAEHTDTRYVGVTSLLFFIFFFFWISVVFPMLSHYTLNVIFVGKWRGKKRWKEKRKEKKRKYSLQLINYILNLEVWNKT